MGFFSFLNLRIGWNSVNPFFDGNWWMTIIGLVLSVVFVVMMSGDEFLKHPENPKKQKPLLDEYNLLHSRVKEQEEYTK